MGTALLRRRMAPVVIVTTLSMLSVACHRAAEDPDRARCKQQMEEFFRQTGAPSSVAESHTGAAADTIVALVAQVKDSKDPYCKLVREKANEIEQRRAASVKAAAEVQEDLRRLRPVVTATPTETGSRPDANLPPVAVEQPPPPVVVPPKAISSYH